MSGQYPHQSHGSSAGGRVVTGIPALGHSRWGERGDGIWGASVVPI